MIVFDAGALIALDRGDRLMWSDVKAAAVAAIDVTVPAAVVSQVWRGSARQARLAMALGGCEIASFDKHAREVGVLCGEANSGDVVDASVALTVKQTGATRLYTSDPQDLGHLLSVLGVRGVQVINC